MKPSDPMLRLLRSGLAEVERDLTAAERALATASDDLRAARARRETFMEQLPGVCSAADLEVEEVLRDVVSTSPSASTDHECLGQDRRDNSELLDTIGATIALPSKPLSLRWFAGQVLHQCGELAISELADEIRRRGFQHSWTPSNPQQLEQSLAALPNQVPWITRGDRPGSLVLNVSRLDVRKPA